jgi:hypothetical protein
VSPLEVPETATTNNLPLEQKCVFIIYHQIQRAAYIQTLLPYVGCAPLACVILGFAALSLLW